MATDLEVDGGSRATRRSPARHSATGPVSLLCPPDNGRSSSTPDLEKDQRLLLQLEEQEEPCQWEEYRREQLKKSNVEKVEKTKPANPEAEKQKPGLEQVGASPTGYGDKRLIVETRDSIPLGENLTARELERKTANYTKPWGSVHRPEEAEQLYKQRYEKEKQAISQAKALKYKRTQKKASPTLCDTLGVTDVDLVGHNLDIRSNNNFSLGSQRYRGRSKRVTQPCSRSTVSVFGLWTLKGERNKPHNGMNIINANSPNSTKPDHQNFGESGASVDQRVVHASSPVLDSGKTGVFKEIRDEANKHHETEREGERGEEIEEKRDEEHTMLDKVKQQAKQQGANSANEKSPIFETKETSHAHEREEAIVEERAKTQKREERKFSETHRTVEIKEKPKVKEEERVPAELKALLLEEENEALKTDQEKRMIESQKFEIKLKHRAERDNRIEEALRRRAAVMKARKYNVRANSEARAEQKKVNSEAASEKLDEKEVKTGTSFRDRNGRAAQFRVYPPGYRDLYDAEKSSLALRNQKRRDQEPGKTRKVQQLTGSEEGTGKHMHTRAHSDEQQLVRKIGEYHNNKRRSRQTTSGVGAQKSSETASKIPRYWDNYTYSPNLHWANKHQSRKIQSKRKGSLNDLLARDDEERFPNYVKDEDEIAREQSDIEKHLLIFKRMKRAQFKAAEEKLRAAAKAKDSAKAKQKRTGLATKEEAEKARAEARETDVTKETANLGECAIKSNNHEMECDKLPSKQAPVLRIKEVNERARADEELQKARRKCARAEHKEKRRTMTRRIDIDRRSKSAESCERSSNSDRKERLAESTPKSIVHKEPLNHSPDPRRAREVQHVDNWVAEMQSHDRPKSPQRPSDRNSELTKMKESQHAGNRVREMQSHDRPKSLLKKPIDSNSEFRETKELQHVENWVTETKSLDRPKSLLKRPIDSNSDVEKMKELQHADNWVTEMQMHDRPKSLLKKPLESSPGGVRKTKELQHIDNWVTEMQIADRPKGRATEKRVTIREDHQQERPGRATTAFVITKDLLLQREPRNKSAIIKNDQSPLDDRSEKTPDHYYSIEDGCDCEFSGGKETLLPKRRAAKGTGRKAVHGAKKGVKIEALSWLGKLYSTMTSLR